VFSNDFPLYLLGVVLITTYLLWRIRPWRSAHIERFVQGTPRYLIGQRLLRLKKNSKGNYKPSHWIVTGIVGNWARVEPMIGLGGSEWIRADKIRR
jgi:hypothetical protein